MKRPLVRASLVILLVVACGLIYHGARTHGFSARKKPNAVEAFLAKNIRRFVVPYGTKARKNPLVADPILVAEARDHFADHCAGCHANDGSGRTDIGQNLYPPAPDMRSGYTQELTDGELFYIIKEGIRLSGMPGWGGEDEENWKLVLFIRHLPHLSAEEIELMREVNKLESPEGIGFRP